MYGNDTIASWGVAQRLSHSEHIGKSFRKDRISG